ncbi:MAG: RNA polymerase sigma-70 factor [Mangrovibacterium sp.]|nr:RNA polymerase sigma-70 factor [Mangrovibacterium sp.]
MVEDDKRYVAALKNGDYEAFNILFRKYTERIYAFTLGITRQKFASEEITQIVFLKVWENRRQIDEHFSFKSFLFSVAYHEIISWIRKEKSERRKIVNFLASFNDSSEETEVKIEFRNLEQITNLMIENFPEKRREIFKLSREHGLSNKEIAQQLSISVKTVEGHMTAALKALREKLGNTALAGCLFLSVFLPEDQSSARLQKK